MWDNLVVKKIFDYCELIRLNKPIGFLLLMWPCWFGLALLKTETSKLLFWYLIFLIGSFLMRSAGCIINCIGFVKFAICDFISFYEKNNLLPTVVPWNYF